MAVSKASQRNGLSNLSCVKVLEGSKVGSSQAIFALSPMTLHELGPTNCIMQRLLVLQLVADLLNVDGGFLLRDQMEGHVFVPGRQMWTYVIHHQASPILHGNGIDQPRAVVWARLQPMLNKSGESRAGRQIRS